MKIIIKITSNFPLIFRNFIKDDNFLNYYFEKQPISKLYIETIENGLLIIFKSYKGFLKFHPVFSEEEIDEMKQNFAKREKNDFKISEKIAEQSFPKEGINIIYSLISEHTSDLVDHLILHFHSLNIKNIDILQQNDAKIIIKFKTKNSLIEYRNFIEYIINRKINSLKEILN